MVPSSSSSILLSNQKRRQKRKELLLFVELLGLYVSAGYDLHYAWSEAVDTSGLFLKPEGHRPMNLFLKDIENQFPLTNYQFFFGALSQLYHQGATLSPALQAFSKTLRRDLERDIEGHLRAAPTKANICLLLFFLPPAIILVVFPFLHRFRQLIFQD